jgi:hypothetical protein
MWDNIVKLGQATDDSMAHVHCMLDNYCYKHTLKICNTKEPQYDDTRTLPALLLSEKKKLYLKWF